MEVPPRTSATPSDAERNRERSEGCGGGVKLLANRPERYSGFASSSRRRASSIARSASALCTSPSVWSRPGADRMLPAQVVVIAKEPVPGRVKTRLTPPFTPREAATLAEAARRKLRYVMEKKS